MKKKIYLFVTISALLGSIALLLTRYIDSLYRIFTALLDFGTSITYYCVKMFANREPTVVPTVNTVQNVDLQKFIPFDLDELWRKWQALGGALFEKRFFYAYLQWLVDAMRYLTIVAMLVVPVVILLGMLFRTFLLHQERA